MDLKVDTLEIISQSKLSGVLFWCYLERTIVQEDVWRRLRWFMLIIRGLSKYNLDYQFTRMRCFFKNYHHTLSLLASLGGSCGSEVCLLTAGLRDLLTIFQESFEFIWEVLPCQCPGYSGKFWKSRKHIHFRKRILKEHIYLLLQQLWCQHTKHST